MPPFNVTTVGLDTHQVRADSGVQIGFSTMPSPISMGQPRYHPQFNPIPVHDNTPTLT